MRFVKRLNCETLARLFSPYIPFTAILMSLTVMYCRHVFKDVISDYLSMFNFIRHSPSICSVYNPPAGFGWGTVIKFGTDSRYAKVHRMWVCNSHSNCCLCHRKHSQMHEWIAFHTLRSVRAYRKADLSSRPCTLTLFWCNWCNVT
jgi:hypothetical protein